MKLDAVADAKRIGPSAIGRHRHLSAKVANEIGRRGRVFGVDPDEDAVERRGHVDRCIGALAMTVETGRRVRRDQVGKDAAALRRLVGRRG
jgi:hypothetical protein